ncbi:hypothetical protein TYRP_011887, partial [Tyrophagus putrescentiae]
MLWIYQPGFQLLCFLGPQADVAGGGDDSSSLKQQNSTTFAHFFGCCFCLIGAHLELLLNTPSLAWPFLLLLCSAKPVDVMFLFVFFTIAKFLCSD